VKQGIAAVTRPATDGPPRLTAPLELQRVGVPISSTRSIQLPAKSDLAIPSIRNLRRTTVLRPVCWNTRAPQMNCAHRFARWTCQARCKKARRRASQSAVTWRAPRDQEGARVFGPSDHPDIR
jgi:hypothetical protein